MTAAAFTLLLKPFNMSGSRNAQAHLEADIYKDQLAELAREEEDGLISSAEAEAAKTEISRRILEIADTSSKTQKSKNTFTGHKKVVLGMLLLIPILSVSLYLLVGEPNYKGAPEQQVKKEQLTKQETIAALTQKVEAHLKKHPNDVKGWTLLARVYKNMGRLEDEKRARENISRIQENASDIASLPTKERGAMIKTMVDGLHAKLKQDGNNLEGWQRLIRSYMVLGQNKDAVASYLEAKKALSGNKDALTGLETFTHGLGILKEIENLQK